MNSQTKMLALSLFSAAIALSLTLSPTTVRADEKFREAFQACLQENNLTPPEKGTKQSKAERKVMHSCLASKGFKHHRHHHHHDGEEAPAAS